MGNNSDSEEVRRFERAFSKCRKCEHMMIAHSFVKPNNGKCVDVLLSVTGEHRICGCKRFIPKDNLEFLEWVAENKLKETK